MKPFSGLRLRAPPSLLFFLLILLWGLPVPPAHGESSSVAALKQEAADKGWVQVIVQLKTPFVPEGLLKAPGQALEQRQRIQAIQEKLIGRLGSGDYRGLKRFKYSPLLAFTVNESGLQGLLAAPEVQRVVKDEPMELFLSDSVPLIGADDAHTAGFAGAGQTVAILDTGVDSSHSFFSGRVVSEACFSTNEPLLDLISNCPNGQESQIGPGAAVPPSSSLFQFDHGTHVAGIAAGGDNVTPFSGVARSASIIAIQVTTNFDDLGLTVMPSDVLSGLERVFELRNTFDIAAVNLSLGFGNFSTPCDSDPDVAPAKIVVDQLVSVGIAIIAASGNDGSTNSLAVPACISSVVSVGSTNKNDTVSSFSNSASFLDLLAPGASINSSVPGGGFGFNSGTSMSAPHVTGAYAVLRSKNPSASMDDMLTALKSTGQPILDTRNSITKPRIQVDAALTQITETSSRDDVLVDFGAAGGVWAYLNDSTWSQISSLGVSAFATGDVDDSGKDDVVGVFPGLGTWVAIDNDHGEQVHQFDAEAVAIGDLNDNLGDDIILDFGPGIGLWVRYDNAIWAGLHSQSA